MGRAPLFTSLLVSVFKTGTSVSLNVWSDSPVTPVGLSSILWVRHAQSWSRWSSLLRWSERSGPGLAWLEEWAQWPGFWALRGGGWVFLFRVWAFTVSPAFHGGPLPRAGLWVLVCSFPIPLACSVRRGRGPGAQNGQEGHPMLIRLPLLLSQPFLHPRGQGA